MACKNSCVETSVQCRKYTGLTKVNNDSNGSSSISSYLVECGSDNGTFNYRIDALLCVSVNITCNGL